MTNKELNNEELNNVNGGRRTDKYLPQDAGNRVGKSILDAFVGSDFYFVNIANPKEIALATLEEIIQRVNGFGFFEYYKVSIKETYGNFKCDGTTSELAASAYDVYFKH